MRDDVTNDQQTALSSATMHAAWMVRLDITGDALYAWTGPGDVSWDSKTWTGVGDLGRVGQFDTDAKGNIVSAECELTQLDSSMLTNIKSSNYKGQQGYIYLAPFDADDYSLIDDPFLLFAGEISMMSMAAGSEKKVSVTIDSRLALLQKSRPRYRTDENHQRDYTGDTFFEYVPKIIGKTLYWGMNAVTPIAPPSSGGGGYGYGYGLRSPF